MDRDGCCAPPERCSERQLLQRNQLCHSLRGTEPSRAELSYCAETAAFPATVFPSAFVDILASRGRSQPAPLTQPQNWRLCLQLPVSLCARKRDGAKGPAPRAAHKARAGGRCKPSQPRRRSLLPPLSEGCDPAAFPRSPRPLSVQTGVCVCKTRRTERTRL